MRISAMWKDIKNFEGKYQVSDKGEVKSLERHVENSSPTGMILKERILKAHPLPTGYLQVSLRTGKKVVAKYIHRLVAEAFLPTVKGKPTVNHIDGDKTNNNVDNLEYASYSENNKHAYDTGLRSRRKNRFTKETVLQIREEAKTMTRRELAEKYKCSKTKIDAIVTRITWKNI